MRLLEVTWVGFTTGSRDKAKLLPCWSIGIQGSFLCRSEMSSHVEVVLL